MTAITLTRAEAAALKPCSLDKLDVFGDRDRLNAREALEAGASVDDLLWVAGQLGLKREIVQFTVAVAERVAHLNPDPRVKAALDAAQAWLDDPSEENRAAARAAAAAAACVASTASYDAAACVASAAASYAAAAAYDAAAAAAAYAAASYAASAAYAAVYTASAAAADYDVSRATARAAQRDIFLAIFCPEDGQ